MRPKCSVVLKWEHCGLYCSLIAILLTFSFFFFILQRNSYRHTGIRYNKLSKKSSTTVSVESNDELEPINGENINSEDDEELTFLAHT